MRVPSGLNATPAAFGICHSRRFFPVLASHTITTPFPSGSPVQGEPVAICVPSGLKAADVINPGYLFSSSWSAPVVASQTRAVLSPPAVTMRLLSALNAAHGEPLSPSRSSPGAPPPPSPGPRVPPPPRPALAPGNDPRAAGAERHPRDRARVSIKGKNAAVELPFQVAPFPAALLHGHLVEPFGRQLVIVTVAGGVGQEHHA